MLRVGIAGLGGIASSHFEAIESLANVEVVAVADLSEERRKEIAKKHNIPRQYPSHTELLKDDAVDAVAVILGHQLHHRLTVDTCKAGKHVLVEKPMALSLKQCDEMIAAAEANNVKLMVGHTQHFYGSSIKAKAILDSGELGPVITAISYMSKGWGYGGRGPQYRSRFHGGGMWIGNGVHVVDRLMWAMASQAKSVSAAIGTRAHYQAGDDSATAFIRCKNGTAGVAIAVAYKDGGPNFDCEVICANGALRFTEHGQGAPYVRLGKSEKWTDVPYDNSPNPMHNEWKGFAESIEKDIEPPSSGYWGRHIMEILFAAEESALSGSEVMLENGLRWEYQPNGVPVTTNHGWI